MMTKKVNKKRNKINFSIKKGMQIRLIFRISIIVLIAVMLSGLVFWLGSHRKVATTYHQFHVQLRNFRDLILPLAMIGTIAGLLGALVLSLFLPLYLAGPLYRIEKILERVADGDLSIDHLTLRSGDELQELVYRISKMIEKIRQRIMSIKEGNRQMEVVCNDMKDAIENSNMKIIKERMSGLDEEMRKTKEILDEFKL